MADPIKPIAVNILLGHAETKAWLEAEIMPDGNLQLIGMSSITEFDQNGKILSHKVEPTGATMLWGTKPKISWWERLLFGRLEGGM